MRGLMIGVGAFLIHQFSWIFYVFGGFLIFTGIKMAFSNEDAEDLEQNIVVRYSRKWLRVTNEYHQDRFSITQNGMRYFTPLFLVLIVVEFTDLIFAVDSIPAIFAVTNDSFIVFTSNVFAVMGLRSLFFAVAGVMGLFHYLKYGLSVILTFIGVKMFIQHWYKLPIEVALGVIVAVLAISILASVMFPQKATEGGDA